MTTSNDPNQKPSAGSQASATAPASQVPPADRKEQIRKRIKELGEIIPPLEKKCAAFDPAEVALLKAANQDLEKSIQELSTLLVKISKVTSGSLLEADLARELRGLKESATLFFTQMKVNPDQWKNLGSSS